MMDTGSFKEVFTSGELKQLRQRVAELEAENAQLRCDTQEVAAARSFLRDQNRLLTQLAAHEAVIKQMREALGICKPLSEYGRVGTRDVDQAKFQAAINKAISLQPTTEHLDAYIKALLGEEVARINGNGMDIEWHPLSPKLPDGTPLYALKENE